MTTLQTTAAPAVTAASYALPPGACDCHSHIFGPFAEFPPLQKSVYALPEAGPETHAKVRLALGVRYGVLTQPAPYGIDPSAMLSAIAGSNGALRAVAVAEPGIGGNRLAGWRKGGIVGLRFTEARAPNGERYPGSVSFEALEDLAPLMRSLDLHAQLWAPARELASWLPRLLRLDVPLVLDHMGCPDAAKGVSDPNFTAILRAIDSGKVWVKLVLARVSGNLPVCDDVRPFHDTLIRMAAERMLWGSDWPYVRMTPPPDATYMLQRFLDWVPDEATCRVILVDNPRAFYRFPGEADERS